MEDEKLLRGRPSDTDAEAVKRAKRTVEDEVKSPKVCAGRRGRWRQGCLLI